MTGPMTSRHPTDSQFYDRFQFKFRILDFFLQAHAFSHEVQLFDFASVSLLLLLVIEFSGETIWIKWVFVLLLNMPPNV